MLGPKVTRKLVHEQKFIGQAGILSPCAEISSEILDTSHRDCRVLGSRER